MKIDRIERLEINSPQIYSLETSMKIRSNRLFNSVKVFCQMREQETLYKFMQDSRKLKDNPKVCYQIKRLPLEEEASFKAMQFPMIIQVCRDDFYSK